MDESDLLSVKVTYTEDYKESAYWVWYRAGKPAMSLLADMLELTSEGEKPSSQLLNNWSKKNNWPQRANILDMQVRREIERQAVQEKVEMFERQATVGKKLIDKAMHYLEDEEWNFRTPKEALTAIRLGAEIERKTRGIGSTIQKISEMESGKLDEKITSLIANAKESDIKELLDKLADPTVIEGIYEEVTTQEGETDGECTF